MSNGERMPLATAQKIGEELIDELRDLCDQIQIAGSVRRKKETVGDLEIVVQAGVARAFLARLDQWVHSGRAKKGAAWGQRYRRVEIGGLKCDFFLADAANWGYIYWLRTGPGDANMTAVTLLKYGAAPYRLEDGYFWAGIKKIVVPDEKTVFKLLGMPSVIPPAERTSDKYRYYMRSRKWADLGSLVYVKPDEKSDFVQRVLM